MRGSCSVMRVRAFVSAAAGIVALSAASPVVAADPPPALGPAAVPGPDAASGPIAAPGPMAAPGLAAAPTPVGPAARPQPSPAPYGPPPAYPYPYPYPYPYSMEPPSPPPTLPYRDKEPIPNGYHMQTRANRGLVIAGSSLFGGAYLLSIVGALSVLSDTNEYYSGNSTPGQFGPLFIPVLGPFIAAATARDASLGEDRSRPVGTLMILDGLTQTAGAILFIGGLSANRKILVRNDLVPVSAKPEVSIGPSSATLRWRF